MPSRASVGLQIDRLDAAEGCPPFLIVHGRRELPVGQPHILVSGERHRGHRGLRDLLEGHRLAEIPPSFSAVGQVEDDSHARESRCPFVVHYGPGL